MKTHATSGRKAGKRLLGLLLVLVMVVGFLPTMALAAVGDEPAHSKTVKDNGDGTFTIALNVTGDSETTVTKANVVVVLDSSGSMDEDTGNAEVTYTATTSDYGTQYGDVDGEKVELHREWVRQGWNWVAVYYYPWTGNANTSTVYSGTRYFRDEGNQTRMEAAQDAVNALGQALLGMNEGEDAPDDLIEMALVDFDTHATAYPVRTTYSSFASDVNGTREGGGTNWEAALAAAQSIDFDDNDTTYVIFVSDGNPTFRDSANGYTQDYNRQNNVYGSGQEGDANVQRCYDAAKIEADKITAADSGYVLYTIGVYGEVSYLQGMGGEYYSAEDTKALQEALGDIMGKIQMAGIGSVSMEDGTTSSVTTSSGEVSSLLTVDETSYKYYRAGGTEEDGSETYDSTANDGLGEEWTDAPAASFENGAVKWNIGEGVVLENGVTYTVTFDCWPSQTTLDIIADLKNDPDSYDDLDPEIQKYIDEDGNLKTNTTATLSYTDTREEDPQPHSTSFTNPPPVTSDSVQQMAVTKVWENELDSQGASSVALNVLCDGDPKYTVNLSSGNSWQSSVYISIGIMREDGTVLAPGHDFTFSEPDDLTYHWELDVPTVRPMQIGENVTMLIKVDEKHQPEDGATTYTIDGAEYYVGSTGAANLTATNHRRSSLNLVKVVEGEDAPEDATFPLTLTVVNSLAPETEPENDPGHDSDYWVWISVRDGQGDEGGNPVTEEGAVTGATANGGGWYYAPSGTAITVNAKAGYSIRLNNLPTGSTYTIEEGDMDTGFVFKSAEIAVTEGDGTAEEFVGDRTSTGVIESTNTLYTVTYTNEYALVNVTVDKVWDDADDQDGLRPDTLELTLNGLPDGVEAPDPEIEESDDGNTWTYTWAGLPKYNDEGEELEYTVTEGTVPEGYEVDGSPAEDGGTITNTHEPETTDITVTKVWDDDDNKDQKRPDTLELTLKGLPSGVTAPTPTIVKSADGNTWTYTWTGVPKNAAGEAIEYTVEEETVPEGYAVTGSPASDGGTITNKHAADTTTITVTKIWDDNSDQDGLRPDSVTFTVTGSDGKTYEVTLSGEGDTWTKDVVVEKNYNPTSRALVTFTVEEEEFENFEEYEAEIDNESLTITNTHEPYTTELTVIKEWVDNDNQDGKRPDSLTVTLSDGTSDVETVTLNEDNKWTATVEVPLNAGGEEIEYTWTEDEDSLPEGYVLTRTEEVEGIITILTNEYEPETKTVSVKKVWKDNDDQDGKRPDSLTVTLEGTYTIDNDTYVVELDESEVTLSEDNEWTAELEVPVYGGGGVEIEYTWTEDEIPEYEAEDPKVSGTLTTLTNTYEPETMELEVTKIWDDNSDQDGKRPDSVTFTVTGSDGNTYTATLSGDEDEWTATIKDVAKYYNGGDEVTFTVEEDEVSDYSADINDDDLTITNSYTPGQTSVTVKKVWSDSNDKDGIRPDSVDVVLLANGEEVETATLSEDNEWTYTWEELDEYADGEKIEYTVDEPEVPEDYTKKVSGFTITNTHKSTPTPPPPSDDIRVMVEKVWDDKDDEAGKRPSSVTVTLMRDGKKEDRVTLNDRNNWSYEWLLDDGPVYTVVEEPVDGYETEIKKGTYKYGTLFTITNKLVGTPDLNTTDHVAYIVGYPDGTVRPGQNITRAEVATIFFRLLTDSARDRYWSQENPYTDVMPDAWYNNAISTLNNMGILNGYADGTFRPDNYITRAELTKIAVSFFSSMDVKNPKSNSFKDVSEDAWYSSFIAAAEELGLVNGYGDGTFRPDSFITRAETCAIVNRTLKRAPHKDHLLPENTMNMYPDNRDTNAWYYADIQEATNSHDYEWVGEEQKTVEDWTAKLRDRDWPALEQTWSTSHSAPGGEVMG